jgi:hypothetical protein
MYTITVNIVTRCSTSSSPRSTGRTCEGDRLLPDRRRSAEAVERLATSEGWLAVLKVAAKFRRYSVNNQLLLWVQAEEREMTLTRVASFGTWKSLGYVVRKGSKGFAILAPKTRLRPDECAAWIKEGRNPYDGEGRPRTVVRGFKVEYVFDQSQVELMEGREAPAEPREWISQEGNGPEGRWSALVTSSVPDPATGRQWTRDAALCQAALAQADGAEVFALLVNDQRQVAYFVRDGRVHRAMLVEGRPWMNDAVPVAPHRPLLIARWSIGLLCSSASEADHLARQVGPRTEAARTVGHLCNPHLSSATRLEHPCAASPVDGGLADVTGMAAPIDPGAAIRQVDARDQAPGLPGLLGLPAAL